MRNVGLLFTRTVLGGYLAVHGAQKLFGAFEGHGLEATGAGFHALGLRPGKAMAALAGASELGGGFLTATGVAEPLGPLAIAGTMAVATAVHRKQGPMSQKGGFELPLTNLAAAVGLLSTGLGGLRVGPRLPKWLTAISVLGATALTARAVSQLLFAEPAAPVQPVAAAEPTETATETAATATA
jgi:putative oxidoreductase